ncbi:flagellar hook-associated protein FlgL [Caulobacteraceae bacterium]
MNRVATGNSYSSVLNDLMRAQVRQQEANAQVSSGKVASNLKGFARQAETLLAARSIQTRVDAFLTQGKTLGAKLESQELALNQTADAAAGARQAIAEALATGHGDALMSELSSWFSSASDSLNARFGGRYLFAGGQVDTPPVSAGAMAELTTQPTVAAFFSNDNLVPANQLDESTTIQSGFLADRLGGGLFDAFRQVQAFADANGDFTGRLTTAQETFLQSMLGDFETARSDLTDATARNGLIQNRVDKTMETQEARQAMLETMVGGITDVDMAEAISRLQQAQTTVQASAQVFNTLSQSSLLNLLQS